MRSAVFTGVRQVSVREAPRPEPGPDEVIVRVRACGICGSDLHTYRAGPRGRTAIPGHEIAGEVAALGERVSGRQPGDRVVVEPLACCHACAACLRGDYQVCRGRVLFGAGQDGGLAEYVRVPAYALFPLPDGLPFTTAALAEPAAVAIHGIRLAEVQAGERVLIQGSGTIGLLSILAAASAGAEVTAAARYPHQIAAARQFGADHVYEASEAGARELAAAAREQPFDAAIETVGGEADTLLQAPALLRAGGRLCVLGVFLHPPRIDALAVVLKEIRVVGAITYGRAPDGIADFDRALALIAAHRQTVETLITHRLPLERVEEAFAVADDKGSHALKVTVIP